MEMHFSRTQSVMKLRILIAAISEVPEEDPSVIYVGCGSAHYAYSRVKNNRLF